MSGAGLALLSAVLFGISMPLAKLLLDQAAPWTLAGLLYLGSGVGLMLVGWRRWRRGEQRGEAFPAAAEWLWLAGAILCGGAVAPVLLLYGLSSTPASTASLLLNLETVLTSLLAWFVLKEQFDRRIALGMAAITAGAAVLSWSGEWSWSGAAGPAAIALACLAWAVDNNLTRKVALSDPVLISALKGATAGLVNLGLATAIGADWPGPAASLATAAVGFVGYGISLVLFVKALRLIGAARTGAYFSAAPFVGAAIGIAVLGDALSGTFRGADGLRRLAAPDRGA